MRGVGTPGTDTLAGIDSPDTGNCDHPEHDAGPQIAQGGQHEDQPGLLAGGAPGLGPGAGGHTPGGVQLGPADGEACQFREVNIVRIKKTGG